VRVPLLASYVVNLLSRSITCWSAVAAIGRSWSLPNV
jgi:hypothetical protein